MKKLLQTLFTEYGADAQLQKEDTRTKVRVFFQVQHFRKLRRVLTPLGEVPQGQYICYFPGDTPVAAGDQLLYRGYSYRIQRCEALSGPGQQIWYYKTLCIGKEGV